VIVPDVSLLADVLPSDQIYCTARPDAGRPATRALVSVWRQPRRARVSPWAGADDDVLDARRRTAASPTGCSTTIARPRSSSVSASPTHHRQLQTTWGPSQNRRPPAAGCAPPPRLSITPRGWGAQIGRRWSHLPLPATQASPGRRVAAPGSAPWPTKRSARPVSCSRRCVVVGPARITIGLRSRSRFHSDAFQSSPTQEPQTVKVALSAKDVAAKLLQGCGRTIMLSATVFGVDPARLTSRARPRHTSASAANPCLRAAPLRPRPRSAVPTRPAPPAGAV